MVSGLEAFLEPPGACGLRSCTWHPQKALYQTRTHVGCSTNNSMYLFEAMCISQSKVYRSSLVLAKYSVYRRVSSFCVRECLRQRESIYIYIYIYIYMCVCVCVCVCKKVREKDREKIYIYIYVCVCVCVCVRK